MGEKSSFIYTSHLKVSFFASALEMHVLSQIKSSSLFSMAVINWIKTRNDIASINFKLKLHQH